MAGTEDDEEDHYHHNWLVVFQDIRIFRHGAHISFRLEKMNGSRGLFAVTVSNVHTRTRDLHACHRNQWLIRT